MNLHVALSMPARLWYTGGMANNVSRREFLASSAALAALVGYFALKAVVRVLHGGRFWMFGLYCLAAGALALAFA